MGLGKTLQSICIIAGDHHSKATTFKVMLLNETVDRRLNNRESALKINQASLQRQRKLGPFEVTSRLSIALQLEIKFEIIDKTFTLFSF